MHHKVNLITVFIVLICIPSTKKFNLKKNHKFSENHNKIYFEILMIFFFHFFFGTFCFDVLKDNEYLIQEPHTLVCSNNTNI